MTDLDGQLAADIRDEAARLGGLMLAAGIPARLMGGLAIWLRSPSVRQGPFARSYADLDFVGGDQGRDPGSRRFLLEQGYLPDQFFNALHGATRLYFQAPDARWSVDVVVDELAMSHKLDLRGRLDGPASTIALGRPAADQAPGLGDQSQGPRRRPVPAGRPSAWPRATGERPATRRRSTWAGSPTCSAPTGASATRSSATSAGLAELWAKEPLAARAVRRRRARSQGCAQRSRQPRSRSPGRPGRGSASVSAGTRPPRKSVTRPASGAGSPGSPRLAR